MLGAGVGEPAGVGAGFDDGAVFGRPLWEMQPADVYFGEVLRDAAKGTRLFTGWREEPATCRKFAPRGRVRCSTGRW